MGVDIAQVFTTWGPLGVIVFLLLTGVLVPSWVYKKLEKENEKLLAAINVERQRNADLQQFAATGQKALTALAQVAQERNDQLPPPEAEPGSGHGG